MFYACALAVKTERGPAPFGAPITARAFGLVTASLNRNAWRNRIEAANGVASNIRKEHTMSKTETIKARPAFRIYSVTKNAANESEWFEIGAAWAHGDGKGFGLQFKAQPLPGAEIVLREPKTKEAEV